MVIALNRPFAVTEGWVLTPVTYHFTPFPTIHVGSRCSKRYPSHPHWVCLLPVTVRTFRPSATLGHATRTTPYGNV